MTELGFSKVLYYFSEIAKIPHGSGNTELLAQYCMNFARQHGLDFYHDASGNVIIFKNGTMGYEQSAPLILQGHLDMVCEKLPECSKNMEREGVDLIFDGDILRARGTTLGGDDGIAVAYILALLASEDIPHPPLEALLTVDEEVGLTGAAKLDASCLKGRRLINIDSEDEGILVVSCAGGARVNCRIPVSNVPAQTHAKKIVVSGLLGGHSGIDINKNRKNALKLLGRFLDEASKKLPFQIARIAGGGRLNVIPSFAEAVICFSMNNEDAFNSFITAFQNSLKKECAVTEPQVSITASTVPAPTECTSSADTKRILSALMQSPYGVYAMNTDIPHLVQTSSNLGEAVIEKGALQLNFMIRSNLDTDQSMLIGHIRVLIESLEGKIEVSERYPAWEYRADSPLRDTMSTVYEEMYGKKPLIDSIHAGLECGILAEKLPGADIVSIGPTMKNVHTPQEYLDLNSAKRVWDYLLQVLKRLD